VNDAYRPANWTGAEKIRAIREGISVAKPSLQLNENKNGVIELVSLLE
jgi:hypothetical protein